MYEEASRNHVGLRARLSSSKDRTTPLVLEHEKEVYESMTVRPVCPQPQLVLADERGLEWSQALVESNHYLHKRVHPLGRLLSYIIQVEGRNAGCLIFGRPQCTRVLGWFGRLSDVEAGRCRFSQWEILNLARVYILPEFQRGGLSYRPDLLPGFTDRKGAWRSTLASTAIEFALDRVVVDYNLLWPPVYLDQPWELRQAISYCLETRFTCTLYLAASFDLVRCSQNGLRTYARDLRTLTPLERATILTASSWDQRARRLRAEKLFEETMTQPRFPFQARPLVTATLPQYRRSGSGAGDLAA